MRRECHPSRCIYSASADGPPQNRETRRVSCGKSGIHNDVLSLFVSASIQQNRARCTSSASRIIMHVASVLRDIHRVCRRPRSIIISAKWLTLYNYIAVQSWRFRCCAIRFNIAFSANGKKHEIHVMAPVDYMHLRTFTFEFLYDNATFANRGTIRH